MNNLEISSFDLSPITDNIGGLNSFLFSPIENIFTLPPVRDNKCIGEVTFIENKTWFKGYATYKTLKFTEKANKNDSGSFFLTEITGFYPKLDPVKTGVLSLLVNHYFVVLCSDNNNNKRLCGSIAFPMTFTFDQDTGSEVSSRNGHSFSFFGESINTSPFYS